MFGEQLKKLRMSKSISQVELAERLNVSKQSVSNWENNNIMPSIDMLKKICMFFSCSSDFLLELTNDEFLIIDSSNLTLKQTTHIKQIVDDLRELNTFLPAEE